MKYSTYLDDDILQKFKTLTEQAGIAQAKAINDAISAYLPVLQRIAETRLAAIGAHPPYP